MTNEHFLSELDSTHTRWKELINAQDFVQSLNFLSLQKQKFSGESNFESRMKAHIAFYQGSTYSQMRNYEAALDSFEESYLLGSEDSVLFCKATTLWMLGRTDEAEDVISSIREPVVSHIANAWLERHKSD